MQGRARERRRLSRTWRQVILQPFPGRVEEMPVAVRGRADRRVAELVLDRLQVRACGDEQRGAGVAEVMESQ